MFEDKNDVYLYNDQIVKVLNKGKRSSNEYEVTYMTPDGKMHAYVADTENEFSDDFIATTEPFILNKTADIKKPQIKGQDKTFDIVYYYNNRKSETLRYNLPQKLAYALKNTFKKDPKYKLGELKVEPNI